MMYEDENDNNNFLEDGEEEGEEYEPDDEEIIEYAKYLGIDPKKDQKYLSIAEEGLKASVPPPWKAYQNENGDIFYVNSQTNENTWKHPLDDFFRQKFERLKAEDEAMQNQKRVPKNLKSINNAEQDGLSKAGKSLKNLPPLQSLKGGTGVSLDPVRAISKKQAMMDLPPRNNNAAAGSNALRQILNNFDEKEASQDNSEGDIMVSYNNSSVAPAVTQKKRPSQTVDSYNASDLVSQVNNESSFTEKPHQGSSKGENSAAYHSSEVDSTSKVASVSGVSSYDIRSKSKHKQSESQFSSQVQKSGVSKNTNEERESLTNNSEEFKDIEEEYNTLLAQYEMMKKSNIELKQKSFEKVITTKEKEYSQNLSSFLESFKNSLLSESKLFEQNVNQKKEEIMKNITKNNELQMEKEMEELLFEYEKNKLQSDKEEEKLFAEDLNKIEKELLSEIRKRQEGLLVKKQAFEVKMSDLRERKEANIVAKFETQKKMIDSNLSAKLKECEKEELQRRTNELENYRRNMNEEYEDILRQKEKERIDEANNEFKKRKELKDLYDLKLNFEKNKYDDDIKGEIEKMEREKSHSVEKDLKKYEKSLLEDEVEKKKIIKMEEINDLRNKIERDLEMYHLIVNDRYEQKRKRLDIKLENKRLENFKNNLEFSDFEQKSTELAKKIKEKKMEMKNLEMRLKSMQVSLEKKEPPDNKVKKFYIDSNAKDQHDHKKRPSSYSLNHESLTNLIRDVQDIKKIISPQSKKGRSNTLSNHNLIPENYYGPPQMLHQDIEVDFYMKKREILIICVHERKTLYDLKKRLKNDKLMLKKRRNKINEDSETLKSELKKNSLANKENTDLRKQLVENMVSQINKSVEETNEAIHVVRFNESLIRQKEKALENLEKLVDLGSTANEEDVNKEYDKYQKMEVNYKTPLDPMNFKLNNEDNTKNDFRNTLDSLADLNHLDLGNSLLAGNTFEQMGLKEREVESVDDSHAPERIRFHSPQTSQSHFYDPNKNLSAVALGLDFKKGPSQRWNGSIMSGGISKGDILQFNSPSPSVMMQWANMKPMPSKEQYKTVYSKHSTWLKELKTNLALDFLKLNSARYRLSHESIRDKIILQGAVQD